MRRKVFMISMGALSVTSAVNIVHGQTSLNPSIGVCSTLKKNAIPAGAYKGYLLTVRSEKIGKNPAIIFDVMDPVLKVSLDKGPTFGIIEQSPSEILFGYYGGGYDSSSRNFEPVYTSVVGRLVRISGSDWKVELLEKIVASNGKRMDELKEEFVKLYEDQPMLVRCNF